jgi:hypothetical protein
MQNDDNRSCECGICEQPMKLVRRLPKMGPAPELLVFYCRDCNEVGSAHWRELPRSDMTLN